jgi:hypothetical protein
MASRYDIDIDREKVRYENEWLGRQELADKIKRMIDSQDYRVAGVGQALEALQTSLAQARSFTVKLSSEDAGSLERMAAASGLSPAVMLRQAIQAYLAAQSTTEEMPAASFLPPPPLPPPVHSTQPGYMTSITTEPIGPGDEASAVPLTSKKAVEPSPVIQPPAAGTPADSYQPVKDKIDDIWFKPV